MKEGGKGREKGPLLSLVFFTYPSKGPTQGSRCPERAPVSPLLHSRTPHVDLVVPIVGLLTSPAHPTIPCTLVPSLAGCFAVMPERALHGESLCLLMPSVSVMTALANLGK